MIILTLIIVTMLLILLLLIPLIGIFIISTVSYSPKEKGNSLLLLKQIKVIALSSSILNLFVSLIVFVLFIRPKVLI